MKVDKTANNVIYILIYIGTYKYIYFISIIKLAIK